MKTSFHLVHLYIQIKDFPPLLQYRAYQKGISWMELASHEKSKLFLDDVRESQVYWDFSRDSYNKGYDNVTVILIFHSFFHSFIIVGSPGEKNFQGLLHISTPARNIIIMAAFLLFIFSREILRIVIYLSLSLVLFFTVSDCNWIFF